MSEILDAVSSSKGSWSFDPPLDWNLTKLSRDAVVTKIRSAICGEVVIKRASEVTISSYKEKFAQKTPFVKP